MFEDVERQVVEVERQVIEVQKRLVDIQRQFIQWNVQKPYIAYIQYQGETLKAAIFPRNGEVWNAVIMETEAAMLNDLTGKHLHLIRTKVPKSPLTSWQRFMGRFFGFMNVYHIISTTV